MGRSYYIAAFSCERPRPVLPSIAVPIRRGPMSQLASSDVDLVIERALAELPFDDWKVIDPRRETKGPRADFVVVGPAGVFVIACGRRHDRERARAKQQMKLLDA